MTAIDNSPEPILPAWMRDKETFTITANNLTRRARYRTMKFIANLPVMVFWLAVVWPWRGIGRVTARMSKWVYDQDSADMRHEHAGNRESPEYARLHAVRKANLHARWMVAATIVLPVAVPALAWTFPKVLSGMAGVAMAVWIIKIIPGRGMGEVAIAAIVGVAIYLFGPTVLATIPRPPVLAVAAVLAAGWLGLGWYGRPQNKTLTGAGAYSTPTELVKPTAEMVVDALCRSNVPGMTMQQSDRVHQETRVIAPGVATSAHGYTVELELPPGVTVDAVVAKRANLAAALRRDLSMVWPSGSTDRHPGYLRLFLSHRPMNKAKQPAWPVATGKPLSIFEPIPMFTNEQQQWVDITLAGTHMAMGGASGSGKSVGLRQLGVALAFALDTRIIVFDGKRSGDLNPIRDLCHGFYEGAEPEDIDEQLKCLRWLVTEREKRARFLASLPRDENRQSKVTAELAAKYPERLSPIVVLFDECQEYTEYGIAGNREDKKIRDEFVALLTKLSRLARSAGIVLVFVSQKPDASVLPSAIMGNCGIRVAFRVLEQVHNDQILGTSARKNGVDATMFTLQDRGVAWVRGGESADTMVARTWSEMVDLDVADELAGKAYALRKAAGLLTGQAADELPDHDADQVDLLADCRSVLDRTGQGAVHLTDLLAGLAELRPGIYSRMDTAALGIALRGAGVRVDQVKLDGRNTSGIRREWLDPETAEEEDGGSAA